MTYERTAELLFGRELRLSIGRWVVNHASGRFYQSEVSADMPQRLRTAVPGELGRFVEAGMLLGEEPNEGQRRRYYLRTESPLWEIFKVSDGVFGALPNNEGEAK